MAFLLQSLRAVRARSGDGDLLPPCLPPASRQQPADRQHDAGAIRASVGAVPHRHGAPFPRQTLEARR